MHIMSRGVDMLKVENICKKFENKEVLKNVSFELGQGEILSIIGPSGAGKSTIMRSINNLESIDSGNILVDGEYLYKDGEYSKVENYSQKIGMVFQNYNLFPHMSVMENIITSLVNVYKTDEKTASEVGKLALEKVNLRDKKNSYPYQLSGGEKQRVAICRAYVLKPKIICLDEPTSALDPESIIDIENLLKSLKSEGLGILIISHDMNFAKRVSDRILFLENGELYSEEDDRVKRFMNI